MTFRKRFTLIMLLVFLNYIFSCSVKTVKVYQEELRSPEEKIVEVVLASGDVITFNDKGGKYQFKKTRIAGVTEAGKPVSIAPGIIDEFRLSRPRAVLKGEIKGQKIFEVIDDLNKKLGMTVILVEHRLDLASKYANHVIIMDEGKVILDGEPREVFNSQIARLIGVGIPKATRLWQMLVEDGVRLATTPVNSDEAAKLFREVLRHD